MVRRAVLVAALAAIAAEDAGSGAAPEPGGPGASTTTFEALDARAEILFPEEGSTLAQDWFEVGINVFTPEPEAFGDLFAGCQVCARLDGKPYACWPIFEMEYAPLFVNVGPGAHELEAVLSDPRSRHRASPLPRTWSGLRRFTPGELQNLPPAFEVGYGVETDEPDRFKALFRSGHVCFELSTAPTDDLATTGGVPCWSLFHAARKPTFSGLGDASRRRRDRRGARADPRATPRPPLAPSRGAPALPNPLAADARALPPEKTPMERLVELKTIFEAGLRRASDPTT
ncbi:hypothetical protein SO694_000890120 [Aureococcus anophagefferens]|uniref:Pherophorin domain-containing protein n=1 Tax=Aureococcus anophagefferens TaxID=44056 RepID=A0ABR1FJ17_AURAN